MANDEAQTIDHLRSVHGAVRSVAEETRERLAELFDQIGATHAAMRDLTRRVQAVEEQNQRVAGDLARIASVLDEESAGMLNRIRADIEAIHGELVGVRDRVSDTEFSVLDAFLSNDGRGSADGSAAEVKSDG